MMELTLLLIVLGRVLEYAISVWHLKFILADRRAFACGIAFVEILLWVWIFNTTLTHAKESPLYILAYAGSGAAGTWIGMALCPSDNKRRRPNG